MGAVVWEPGMSLSGDLEGSRVFEAGFSETVRTPPGAAQHVWIRRDAGGPFGPGEGGPQDRFPPERDAVRAALRETDLLLPLERLKFDEHGDPLFYQVGIFQIQGGRHVLLFPRDKATGELIRPQP